MFVPWLTSLVSSTQRQTGMVALHIMVPYLAAYLYTRFRRHARQQQQQQQENPSSTATQTRWQRLALWSLNLPAFDSLMQDHVRPLHLALFFLMGRYYSLSKRWFQIRYVSAGVTLPGQDEASRPIPDGMRNMIMYRSALDHLRTHNSNHHPMKCWVCSWPCSCSLKPACRSIGAHTALRPHQQKQRRLKASLTALKNQRRDLSSDKF